MAIDNKMNIENEENIEEMELASQFDNQKALNFKDGQEVILAGIITSIKKKYTKTNKIMAFVTVEDLYGQVDVLTFENAYLAAKDSLEKTTIIANEITNFGVQKRKVLNINITTLDEETKKKLRGAIRYFNGQMNNIGVQVQDGDKVLKCGAIYITDKILEVFQDIVGKENAVILEME